MSILLGGWASSDALLCVNTKNCPVNRQGEIAVRMNFLGCYAPQAVKGLIAGSDREAAIKALLDTVGGTLVSLAFTRGEYDVIATVDVPDQNSGMGLTMAVRASGAFTKMTILEELDMGPIVAAAQKAAKIYEPAG